MAMRQAGAGRAPHGIDPVGRAEAGASLDPGRVPAVSQADAQGASPAELRRLLDSAEHFLVCRDRARAFEPWAGAGAPASLSDAIARDFAGFDLEQAEADFRAALAALSGRPIQPVA